MEPTADGVHFQEEDHVRLISTIETGRIKAITSEFVYVLMDSTNERRLFAIHRDGNATLELVLRENRPGVNDQEDCSLIQRTTALQ